jgi:hypothetical protein
MIGYRFTIFLSTRDDYEPFRGRGEFTIAYEGRIATDDPLEDLFGTFTLDPPDDYGARALRVGDLISLAVDGREYVFACEAESWEFVTSGVPEVVALTDNEKGAA